MKPKSRNWNDLAFPDGCRGGFGLGRPIQRDTLCSFFPRSANRRRTMRIPLSLAIIGFSSAFLAATPSAHADNFGSGANTFTIDFVTIGNPGNAHDTGGGGGSYSTPYGDVAYDYRMGVLEISQDMIDKATNLGLGNVVGSWADDQPAAEIDWYEAAAFVNWLNQDYFNDPTFEAYDLNWTGSAWELALWDEANRATTGVDSGTNAYRHKDAYYFLPSEDEWYKAAYHQNDGVTANYWDYPTGSNTTPDGIDSNGDPNFDAVFFDGYTGLAPNDIDNAGSAMSAYGTYGQGGNVWEWNETAFDGSNNINTEHRAFRGGPWGNSVESLRSSIRIHYAPSGELDILGFRVASVIPEPTSALLLLTGLGLMAVRRWL